MIVWNVSPLSEMICDPAEHTMCWNYWRCLSMVKMYFNLFVRCYYLHQLSNLEFSTTYVAKFWVWIICFDWSTVLYFPVLILSLLAFLFPSFVKRFPLEWYHIRLKLDNTTDKIVLPLLFLVQTKCSYDGLPTVP